MDNILEQKWKRTNWLSLVLSFWLCNSECVSAGGTQRRTGRSEAPGRVSPCKCAGSFKGCIVCIVLWLIWANSSGNERSCLKQQYWDPGIKIGFRYIFKEVLPIPYLLADRDFLGWRTNSEARGPGLKSSNSGCEEPCASIRLGALMVSWSSLCKL